MKILCIMPHYHANTSANNNCMQHVIDYFKKQGHAVDIFCIDNKQGEVIEQENGSHIISVLDEYKMAVYKWGAKYNASQWNHLPKHISFLIKVKCFIKTVFRPKTNYYGADAIAYRRVFRDIKQVQKHYDVVISHSFPMVSHVIADRIYKKGLADKWFAIKWDPFVYNKLDPEREVKKRQKTAERILNHSNGIFMLEGIMDENVKNDFEPLYHQKTVNIHLPILKDRCAETKVCGAKTVMVYTGVFYSDIRRPDVMLDVLSQLPMDFELQIYGHGCQRIIEEKAKKFQEQTLKLCGRVSRKTAMEAVEKADVLVNVGNTISNQIPSKVFEYMSFGKPIINFYSTEEDLGLRYLKKYPLCFNFNATNYTQKDVEDLIHFCEENKDKRLTFEEVTKDLSEHTAEAVCQKIYSTIMQNI